MDERLDSIVFVINNWGDSHQMTRAIELGKLYAKANYWGFERDYYPNGFHIDNGNIIAKVKHGSYWSRIFPFIKAIQVFREIGKKEKGVAYIYGLDNLLLFYLANIKRVERFQLVYEVSDIRAVQMTKGSSGRLVRGVESWLLNKISLLVVTSPAYVQGFYKKTYPSFNANFHVFENKIHEINKEFLLEDDGSLQKKKSHGGITIGYFGLLRCKRTLDILLMLAESSSKFNIIVRGYFMGELNLYEEKIKRTPNIAYLGTYVSPKDLKAIYSEVDMSWICYPYSEKLEGNWRWARTNRYYEAGFHGVPMIALDGTQDGHHVEGKNIGMVVSLHNKTEALDKLQKVTVADLFHWKKNIQRIPKREFAIQDDYKDLKVAIDSTYPKSNNT